MDVEHECGGDALRSRGKLSEHHFRKSSFDWLRDRVHAWILDFTMQELKIIGVSVESIASDGFVRPH
jgi:hypothetical protein